MTEDRRQGSGIGKNGTNVIRAFLPVCFLIPVFCLLTACGFHPVYGAHGDDGSPVAERMYQVAIDPIPDRPGQMLRNDLIDRMYGKGRPAQPAYHLVVKLRISEEDLGLLANATTALSGLHAYGDFVLTDAGGKTVLSGAAHSMATYDKLSSQYATLAARDGAIERTVREVSEQITSRLSLYFAEQAAPSPSP
jgi:LPS-assembly lipoprotein